MNSAPIGTARETYASALRSRLDKGSSTATAYPSKSDIPFPVAVFPVNVCPREAGSK